MVSPLFDWQYNPNIIPEISHNIDVNFQKYHDHWSLGVSTFLRIRKDVILWTALADDDRQIFRYENSGTVRTYGLELNLNIESLTLGVLHSHPIIMSIDLIQTSK